MQIDTTHLGFTNILSSEIHMLDYPAWIFDERTLRIVDANRKAIEFCLYNHHEIVGLSITELWHDDDLVHILNDIVIHNTERSFFGNLKHRKKNGEIVMMRVKATRLSLPRTSWMVHLVGKNGSY